jgi:hypothetical protein
MLQSARLSLSPPTFNAKSLSVRYLDALACGGASSAGSRRRYTLTHNDVTGALLLSIGAEYDAEQVAGWYTRLLRDEVLAEYEGGALHVHVHVCGEADWWLAPSWLRALIFRREMPLVLDTLRFADRDFLLAHAVAPVAVHFHYAGGQDRVETFGRLFSIDESAGRASGAADGFVLASPPLRLASLGSALRRRRGDTADPAEILVGTWSARKGVTSPARARAGE